MLLIFAGRDGVRLMTPQQDKICDRFGLESQLPPLLHELKPQTIYLIAGPGSFTNLRVTCLTLNSYKLFHPETHILELDTLRFYAMIDILPRYGLIFIGQKKRAWLYDFVDQYHHKVSRQQTYEHECFCENLNNNPSQYDMPQFALTHRSDETQLIVTYQSAQQHIPLSQRPRQAVDYCQAHYILEPTVTMSSQTNS